MTKCRNGLDRLTAYRVGLCVECGVMRHSAGRPRCNDCHGAPGDAPSAPNPYICLMPDCSFPARPGRLRCDRCFKIKKESPA